MKTCEHGFDYERWPNHTCQKCRIKAWRRKNKEKVNKQQQEWRKNNPGYATKDPDYKKKRNARSRVMKALKDGRLTRPEHCTKCGKEGKPEAHHVDYDKPLEVQWLCTNCHVKEEA